MEIIFNGSIPGEGGLLTNANESGATLQLLFTSNENVGNNTRRLSTIKVDYSIQFMDCLRGIGTKQVVLGD